MRFNTDRPSSNVEVRKNSPRAPSYNTGQGRIAQLPVSDSPNLIKKSDKLTIEQIRKEDPLVTQKRLIGRNL